jgi:hypothetical protein
MQLQQLKFQLRCVKKARGDIKRPAGTCRAQKASLNEQMASIREGSTDPRLRTCAPLFQSRA